LDQPGDEARPEEELATLSGQFDGGGGASFDFGATLSPPVAGESSVFAGTSDVAGGGATADDGSAGAAAAGAASAGAALSFFAHAVMNIVARSTANAVVMVFIVSLSN